MWRTLNSATRYLTLKAHETDTEEGRNIERYRLAAWNAIVNLVSAVVSMASLFLVIRFALPNLGPERFGIWMAISSLTVMLSFLDLGVGNGLVNQISKASAQAHPDQRLKEIIFRGLGILVVIGCLAWIFLNGITTFIKIEKLLKINSEILAEEARSAVNIFIFIFSIGIPISGIQKILYGLQKSWAIHLVRVCCSLVSILLVMHTTQSHTSIPTLLILTYGIQTCAPLLLIWMFKTRGSASLYPIKKSRHHFYSDIKLLTSSGLIYFTLQLTSLFAWGSDSFVISSQLGATAVSGFVIAQRLFQLVSLPLSIANSSAWPAYAHALSRNDTKFIQSTLKKSLTITLIVSTSLSIFVFAVSGPVLSLWIQNRVEVSTTLLACFMMWSIIEATGNCVAMYLNGTNIIKPQMYISIVFCIVAFTLKILLTPWLGVSGVLIATIIAYLTCVVPPYYWLILAEFKPQSHFH